MIRKIVLEKTGWGPWEKNVKYAYVVPEKGVVHQIDLDLNVSGLGVSRALHTGVYCLFVIGMLNIIF